MSDRFIETLDLLALTLPHSHRQESSGLLGGLNRTALENKQASGEEANMLTEKEPEYNENDESESEAD